MPAWVKASPLPTRTTESYLSTRRSSISGESRQPAFWEGTCWEWERIGGIRAALRPGAVTSHTRPLHTKGRVYENSYYRLRDDAGSIVGTLMVTRGITEKEQLKDESLVLREQIRTESACGEMVARSAARQPVFEVIGAVASLESTILIGGEGGTGKELAARGVHQQSRRSAFPLIKVNSAALPDNLLESELFGYDKGAHTGAVRERKGRFEQSQRGTIVLDEIGEMPLTAQAELLWVLQEKTVERIGSNREIRADVRIVAATNRDLKLEVEQGRFRVDLYCRLNVIPLLLPPFRDRREEILPLAERFLAFFAKEMGKLALVLTPEGKRLLLSYHFPGNVGELKNAVERAVAVTLWRRQFSCRLPRRLHVVTCRVRNPVPPARTDARRRSACR